MKASIFLHEIGGADVAGTLLPVLQARGVSCDFIDAFDGGLDAGFDALAPDLLIVMGGPPGAYQAHQYDFLRREIDILEKRLAADLPVLGICLGAQLMAAALGARNYKGEQGAERGWCNVAVTPAGMKSAVRHFDRGVTKVPQLHQDTFDLPQGATLLASSDLYENQAFSWGRNALALQFHPEMTPRLIRHWTTKMADAVHAGKADLKDWADGTEKYSAGLARSCESFMNEWLDHIGGAQGKRGVYA